MAYKRKNNGAQLPFNDDAFIEMWGKWLAYRSEQRFPSYKPIGLKLTFDNLVEISGNNSQTACEIIKRSICNSWRGLFPLPKNYNNANTANHQQPITASGLEEAFNRRIEQGL